MKREMVANLSKPEEAENKGEVSYNISKDA